MISACSDHKGVDGVIYGGSIYTATDLKGVEAVAFDEGKIVYVGNKKHALSLTGGNTQHIDINGGMLMPGLIDAHVHPLLYALFSSYPSLESAKTVDELIDLMKEYSKDAPESEWVIGFGFPMGMFSDELPTKEMLDKHFPDRPVALISHHMHNWWVNSAALDAAEITAETPDPKGGFIHRVSGSQEPSGFLEDKASYGLFIKDKSLMPAYSKMYAQFNAIFDEMASLGYVGYMDAGVEQLDVAIAYAIMDKLGLIKLKGSLAMIVFPDMELDRIKEIARIRSWLESDSLKMDVAKFWIDGNIDTRHAYMKEQYLDSDTRGHAYFSTEVMTEFIKEAEAYDLNTHIHVLGDAALSETLDAFSEVAKTQTLTKRHYFTHLQIAEKSDVERLAEMGLGINISPSWAHRDVEGENGKPVDFSMVKKAVGERICEHELYLPFRTIYESGARVSTGSDYPFTTLNPYEAIEVGLTRQHHGNNVRSFIPLPIQPNQKVDLDNLLRSYTIEAAYQLGREEELGSIEIGKSASFAILDRNLFQVAPQDIGSTKVAMTLIDGEIIYGRSK